MASKTPEGKVKDVVRLQLKLHGIYFEQETASAMGTNGRPDIRCSRKTDGHFGGIETKAGTWKVSALQRVRLREIAASNGSAMVVNETNIDMAVQWMGTSGWKITAVINDKEVCTHHIASHMDGSHAFEIKNPPVTRTKRAKGP